MALYNVIEYSEIIRKDLKFYVSTIKMNQLQTIDVVMPMYNVIEYSEIIRKDLKFYISTIKMNKRQTTIIDFLGNPDSTLFKYKQKIKDQTKSDVIKDV